MVNTKLECKHCGRNSKSRKKCTFCRHVMGNIARPVKGAKTVHGEDENAEERSRDSRGPVIEDDKKESKDQKDTKGGKESSKAKGEWEVDLAKERLLADC